MKKMKISSIETSFLDYPSKTTLLVFMSGCSLNCEGCQNPALKNPSLGYDVDVEYLISEYKKRELCNSITFSGGDPLYQTDPLIYFCKKLSKITKIGIYTGHSLSDVPEELFKYISFLKTEPYIEKRGGLDDNNTNQKCWDIINGIPVENKLYFKQ